MLRVFVPQPVAWEPPDPFALIVDDEEIVRSTARHFFEAYRYTVAQAANRNESPRLFRARTRRYDLVLLDLAMPVKDGKMASAASAPSIPRCR